MNLRSKPPTKAPRARRSYTLLWFKNETAAPVRLSLSKTLLTIVGVALFVTVGVVAAMSLEYTKLKATSLEYEKLRVENRSIRSEAKALSARLQEIQSTLTQVDTFSSQVRAVVQMETDAKKKSLGEAPPTTDLKVDSFSQGIGPLTKDEFAIYQTNKNNMGSERIATSVNTENLEFKNLFVTLNEIKEKGGSQAKHLEVLVGDLQAYRKQIDATPTISPVQGAISSMYGKRNHPLFKGTGNRMHWGLDIAAPMGSPIRSAANGTVVRVGHVDDYGNFVEVSHGYGVVTRYAHASAIHVKVGDKIEKGRLLGAVGATGRTTGPHLHYEIEVNGRKVDPSTYIQNF